MQLHYAELLPQCGKHRMMLRAISYILCTFLYY
jgi:hypothetical protein